MRAPVAPNAPISLINRGPRSISSHTDQRELARHIAHFPKDGPIIREEQIQASWRTLVSQARAAGDRSVLMAIAVFHRDLEAFLNR